jgi:geranylgeranyl pyrophosphate synthase
MGFEEMKAQVRAIPEVAAWPEMLELIERVGHREGMSVWDYPVAACRAVGGTAEDAQPGAAAVFCSLLSIHLVDDILDEDPRGDHIRLGTGPAANLALAFQAAGHRLLGASRVDARICCLLHATFARMGLATAFGQSLDLRDLRGEEDYWNVVEAKTPPLFGAAFRLGALLGGAPEELADEIEQWGNILGRFIQVSDDLADSLQVPPRTDWHRRSNNLPILFAMTAQHPDRERFAGLASRYQDPEALEEAQKILLRSGAVSYCAFKMIEISQESRDRLARLALRDAAPLDEILTSHLRPLHRLLAQVGVEDPSSLAEVRA